MLYTNDKLIFIDNLPIKAHFTVHHLLVKMPIDNISKQKMWLALKLFIDGCGMGKSLNRNKLKVNSKLFEQVRKENKEFFQKDLKVK